jgi:hypothetical protein
MINERDRHIWRPIATGAGDFRGASHSLFPTVSPRSASTHVVTDAMTIFVMVVGVTALLCYVVVKQSQNRRVNRKSSGDSSWSADTSHDGDNGGYGHGGSTDHSGSGHASHSGDSGAGDSSGSGDSGGGGDGGDGGGGGSD